MAKSPSSLTNEILRLARLGDDESAARALKLLEGLPAAVLRGEQSVTKLANAGPIAEFTNQVTNIRRELLGQSSRSGRLPVSFDEAKVTINALSETAVPQAKAIKAELLSTLNSIQVSFDANMKETLKVAGITDPVAVSKVLDETVQKGFVASPKTHPELFKEAVRIQQANTFRTGLIPTLAKGGFKLGAEGEVSGGGLLRAKPEQLTAAIQEGTGLIQTGGTPDKGLMNRINKLAGKGGTLRGIGKFAGGAGIAALLLKSLVGGDQKQQLPPMMQIQLLQQMQEAQQKQALTDSLVGSRQASADRDIAKTMLLRLQALSQGGGLPGGVV